MRIFAIFIILLTSGCHKKMPSLFPNENPQSLLAKVQEVSTQNQQLSGRFKLRGTGIKRLLGSIDLDIIAQRPHYFYLSIDSFFKQPARIVTYDGTKLYGLDEEKLDAILNLDITPEELSQILLRNADIDPKNIKKLTLKDNVLKIILRSGSTLSLWLNSNFDIQKRQLRDNLDQVIYTVTYEDYPKRFYLEATYKNQKHEMSLTSQDVTLNQGVFDEQLFRR
jgi:hypothetical protein